MRWLIVSVLFWYHISDWFLSMCAGFVILANNKDFLRKSGKLFWLMPWIGFIQQKEKNVNLWKSSIYSSTKYGCQSFSGISFSMYLFDSILNLGVTTIQSYRCENDEKIKNHNYHMNRFLFTTHSTNLQLRSNRSLSEGKYLSDAMIIAVEFPNY